MSNCNCPCMIVSIECVVIITPLNWNMNNTEIAESFCTAHSDYLKNVLGKDCYKQICEAFDAGKDSPDTIDDKWKNLAKECQKYIAWATYYVWLDVYGRSKATSKGNKLHEGTDLEAHANSLNVATRNMGIQEKSIIEYLKDNNFDCYKQENSCNKTPQIDLDSTISVV